MNLYNMDSIPGLVSSWVIEKEAMKYYMDANVEYDDINVTPPIIL